MLAREDLSQDATRMHTLREVDIGGNNILTINPLYIGTGPINLIKAKTD